MTYITISEHDRLWLKWLIANAGGVSLVDNSRAQFLLDGISAPAAQAAEPRGMSAEDRMDCYQFGTVDQWPAEMRKPDAGSAVPAIAAAVEAMRQRCERIVMAEINDWRGTVGSLNRILDAIRALKETDRAE